MQGIGRYADKVSTATRYLFLANCHKLRARATGELSNAQINLEGQLKESSMYTVGGSSSDNTPGGGSGGDGGGLDENPLG